ncbi:MAG TPA: aminotransferase class I/II-fold pyridoxal phosphate-dependent enzyme [bacterium]|nr:aminotransferase class I/II-fold pyridoxal phosphate-dependent enzyme [bacterium]
MIQTASRVAVFTESVIREMTRLAAEHGGINLAQGFPDFPAPAELVEAAGRALADGYNQYAITWGSPRLRRALAEKVRWFNGIEADPERNITVTCGATEAMMATLLATVNPGDEVVVFEPFYENYGPDAKLSGAVPRFVRIRLEPGFPFDPDELRNAIGPRTKAIIVTTPHNPTGKVFTRAELELIADQCRRHDLLAITDEVYEHIVYDGAEHVSLATLPGMAERTVIVNSISKSYSVTGWRVGWAIAPAPIADGIRKVHDFLTVGAAAPLQEAAVVALGFPRDYYRRLAEMYQRKRDTLLEILHGAGFPCLVPAGAYYIICDISGFGFADDYAFTMHLIKDVGVAPVPGSSFFHDPAHGKDYVRFAFPKREETFDEVRTRLRRLGPGAGSARAATTARRAGG